MIGAIIMLTGILRVKDLMEYVPFVSEKQQQNIKWYLVFHRGLMAFFFCGYLVVLTSFAFHFQIISETFVSIIFLFGAVFVYIGITVQSRLLAEVQATLSGILPICSKCKKVRPVDGDPDDQHAWKRIEDYISQQPNVAFSHGYCPVCYAEEMQRMGIGKN